LTGEVKTGRDLLVRVLESLGTEVVFGVPGTQNFSLYQALQNSAIRPVLTTSELAASFAANGYFRRSGKVAVLATIGGPGLTYALSGIAEARMDSAGILFIVFKSAAFPDRRFRMQGIDEQKMAAPVVKKCFTLRAAADLPGTLREAFYLAGSDEPGPVYLEIASPVLQEKISARPDPPPGGPPAKPAPSPEALREAVKKVNQARRPLLLVGQGAGGAAAEVRRLAELLSSPVLATSSGRGIVPEDHPRSFALDAIPRDAALTNTLFEKADLVLALGCKFSHHGSAGFRLSIAPEKLIHVDASDDVLNANYPAGLAIRSDTGLFLQGLLADQSALDNPGRGWEDADLDQWRAKIDAHRAHTNMGPAIAGMTPASFSAFFKVLRRKLPRDACLLTDSGLHQEMTRLNYQVLAPRSFFIPADFQSMGFGLAAAIGAKLAAPGVPVLAVVGDGGMALSGLELITSVREELPVKVIVFNDGYLNLIRLKQLYEFGESHLVRTGRLDLDNLAAAMGIPYFRLDNNLEAVLDRFLDTPGSALLDVAVRDSFDIRKMQFKSRIKNLIGRW
jgi:acetolactate synthase-1/2/3 large subunit